MNVSELTNTSEWCNDKIILNVKEGQKALVNANTIMHIEEAKEGCTLWCTEGFFFDVTESMEEVLGLIKDLVSASKERKEAAKKAEEERYKAMMEQAKGPKANA